MPDTSQAILENIMPSERSQSQKTLEYVIPFMRNAQTRPINENVDVENKPVVAEGWQGWGKEGLTASRQTASFQGDQHDLKLMMVTQPGEHTKTALKNHRIAHYID